MAIKDPIVYDSYKGKDASAYGAWIQGLIDSSIEVTDRNDIINPYDLIDINAYKKTRAGKAQYEADLNALLAVQSQQQAFYEDWYNSPEQVALRERSAGLNPDIIGLDGAAASSAEMPNTSPVENMETNSQVALNVVAGISQVMQTAGSLASLASTFSQIPVFQAQKDLIKNQADGAAIANVGMFEQLAHKSISDRFAAFHAAEVAAGRTVDIASWFADDANFSDILTSYAPSESPMYSAALGRVRAGTERLISDAYSANADRVTNQTAFSRALANPYFDDDTKLMVANLEPIMQAVFELEQSSLDFQNQANKEKIEYIGDLDAAAAADAFNKEQKYQALITKHQEIIERARKTVFDNLRKTYEHSPLSPASFAAGLQILGQTPSAWQSFLMQYGASLIGSDWSAGTLDIDGDPVTDEGGLGFHMGRPTK